MQLICNGQQLDLYESANLQFAKQNPAFAFGEMSSERTTQFKLPKTPNNDKIFALARVPACYGEGMRRKFDATLQFGVIVSRGSLYVSSFDGKDYAAIFVAGLAYDIKAFGNYQFGSLILPELDLADFPSIYDANTQIPSVVNRVKYHSDSVAAGIWAKELYKPSIDLGRLFEQLNIQGVFPITGVTGERYRLIRNDIRRIESVKEVLTSTPNVPDDFTLTTENNAIKIDQIIIFDDGVTQVYAKCFQPIYADTHVFMTFPDDMPENLCMCYAIWDDTDQDGCPIGFIGSRRFEMVNGQLVYTGEPLAGQTIDMYQQIGNQTPNKFVFMTGAGASFVGGQPYIYFGNLLLEPAYEVEVRVSADQWYTSPHSMLIDLSFGELLKAYSVMSGLLLNVKSDGSVEFTNSFDQTPIYPEIISFKSLQRTFSDYARKNIIQFAQEDEVFESEKLRTAYYIDNDNLEDEKTLLELKYIEGGLYDDGTDNMIYLRGVDDEYPYAIPKEAIGKTGSEEFMTRTELVNSPLLEDLCAKSTLIEVTARMSYAQYYSIEGMTTFAVRNNLYAWTKASWQKNVATLTLQKIL